MKDFWSKTTYRRTMHDKRSPQFARLELNRQTPFKRLLSLTEICSSKTRIPQIKSRIAWQIVRSPISTKPVSAGINIEIDITKKT